MPKDKPLELVRIPLSQIKPDPKNAKDHDVGLIIESFKRFGYVNPMVLNSDDFLLAGHGRRKALLAMQGDNESPPRNIEAKGDEWIVPVGIGPDFDQKEGTAYRLVDNRSTEVGGYDEPQLLENLIALSKNGGLEATGYDQQDVDQLFRLLNPSIKEIEVTDEAEVLREKWGTESGQLWEIGEHRLICGDCTDADVVARVMDGESAGAVVTDPPYAIFGSSTGVKSDVSDDNLIRPFFREIAKLFAQNTKQRGHIYVFCDWRSFPVVRDEIGKTLEIKNNLVWSKGETGYAGSFYSNNYENIALFVNEFRSQSMFKSFNEKGTPDHRHIYHSNVWDFPRVPIKNREHFAEKPVEVLEKAITNSTDIGELVFDPFLGSGTTMVAAEQLNRICYGMEIEPKYVAVTLERMSTMGLEPKLLS